MIKLECLVIPDMFLLLNMKALKAEIILCPALKAEIIFCSIGESS